MNELISIIIPVHNGKYLLNSTIVSCLRQKYHHIEIIVVDDGSTDSLTEDDLIKSDKIRYFKKNNEGPGLARNFGIDKAKGKYIFFLDADDNIPINALPSLLQAISKKDFSVGRTERLFFDRNNTFTTKEMWKENIYKKLQPDKYDLIHDTLCTNKLYKKLFLLKSRLYFSNDRILEDKLFILKLLEASQNFAVVNETVYHWSVRQGTESLSTVLTIETLHQRMDVNYRCISFTDDERMKSVLIENIIKHDLRIYVNHSYDYTFTELQQLYDVYRKFIEHYKMYIHDMSFRENKKIIKNISNKYLTINEFLNISYTKNKIDIKDSHHMIKAIILKIFLKLENFGIKL